MKRIVLLLGIISLPISAVSCLGSCTQQATKEVIEQKTGVETETGWQIAQKYNIPKYPKATNVNGASSTTAEGETGTISFTSGDPDTKIVDFYKNEMKSRGWQEENTYTLGALTTVTWKKGTSESASLSVNTEKEERDVVVGYVKQK